MKLFRKKNTLFTTKICSTNKSINCPLNECSIIKNKTFLKSFKFLVELFFVTDIPTIMPELYRKVRNFFSIWVLFHIHESHDSLGKGEANFYSSLPLSPASRTLRRQLSNCCRIHFHSNWETLVSESKSLTNKLRALESRNLILITCNMQMGPFWCLFFC